MIYNTPFSYRFSNYRPEIFQQQPGEFSYRPRRIFSYNDVINKVKTENITNKMAEVAKKVCKTISKTV